MPTYDKDEKGKWETCKVRFHSVADNLTKTGDMKLVFEKQDQAQVLLTVPPDEPADCLGGLYPKKLTPPTDEGRLREWIPANVTRDWVTAKINGNFVDSILPDLNPDGSDREHEGQLVAVQTYIKKDVEDRKTGQRYDQPRIVFVIETDDGKRIRFTDPIPEIEATIGKTPMEDGIGPSSALYEKRSFWYHLMAFGFSMTDFFSAIQNAKGLWPRDGFDEPLFRSADLMEWAEQMPEFIKTPARVKFTVTNDKEYGIGPKRDKMQVVILNTAPTMIDPQVKEWEDERAKMCGMLDLLTGFALAKDAKFADGDWRITEDGMIVAAHFVKVLLNKWQHLANIVKDGDAKIRTPIAKRDEWSTEAFVAIEKAASVLVAAHGEGKVNLADLDAEIIGPKGHDRLLAWMDANPDSKFFFEFKSGKEL